jgi:hypothetical protein
LGLEKQAVLVGSPLVCSTSRELVAVGVESVARRDQGTCFARTTFQGAKEKCSSLGMRLCTHKELLQGDARMPGCGLAYSYILSSTMCKNSDLVMAIPGPRLAKYKKPACVKQTQELKHLCCADMTASDCAQ